MTIVGGIGLGAGSRERRALAVLAAFALAATALGRAFTALHPNGFDAQLFAAIGDLWRQGLVPYRDAWDNKPPGVFALIALTFSVFPRSFPALAAVEGVFVLGCLATLYRILRRLRAPGEGVLLGTLCAAIATNLVYFNQLGLYTEVFALWPAALGMLCFLAALEAPRAGRLVFLAGLCAGLAALFKPPGLAPLLAQASCLILLALAGAHAWRPTLRWLGLALLGVAAAWLPALVYFAQAGALAEMIEGALLYNLGYAAASQTGLADTLRRSAAALLPLLHLVPFLALAGWLLLRPGGREARAVAARPGALCVGLWVLFDLAGALAGGRAYPHYFLPLAASLPVAAGLAYGLAFAPPGAPGRRHRWPVLLLLLAPLAFYQGRDLMRLAGYLEPAAAARYWHPIARQLERRAGPGDTLFVWGYQPAFYLASGLRSPSRFLGAHYLRDSARANATIGAEILSDLGRDKPTFVVDYRGNDRWFAGRPDTYGAFKALLRAHYAAVHRGDPFTLYRLRPDAATSAAAGAAR